ncbi:putative proteasome endopeptidase complex [Rosa chinensis]|uniref:Putative proteasome endopeptidase complex n=1 Tax=Rosa chinensis TaxID=74649 RepID=A0A2P6Q666_ROSCH|nr:putative proteasome endopeptidase complex [Rosa chinensis]
MAKHEDVYYEAIVKFAEGFNGADLQTLCPEAGMFAIHAQRDYKCHARRYLFFSFGNYGCYIPMYEMIQELFASEALSFSYLRN